MVRETVFTLVSRIVMARVLKTRIELNRNQRFLSVLSAFTKLELNGNNPLVL
jgi:hypothetical protein